MPITYNETGVAYDAGGYTFDGEVFQPTVFPIAGVYIAFDDGPYTASPVWTEVTQYVRGFTTHRGRSSDFDQFDTGTAQITLSNRDRRFDPFYTSGPYFGKLLPRRQVRVVGQIGGSTYEVFRGFIAGWPVTWSEAGYDSTVTVQCFDALGLMANEQVPTDWLGFYTLSLNPRRYYRCNDSVTSLTIKDQNNTVAPLNMTSAPTPGKKFFQADSLFDGILGTAAFFNNSYYNTTTIGSTTESDLTLSLCWKWTQNPGSTVSQGFYYIWGGILIEVYVTFATGEVSIRLVNKSNQRTYTSSGHSQNTPYHFVIAVAANSGGTPSATIYRNGDLQSWSSTTLAGPFGFSGVETVQILGGAFTITSEIAVIPYQVTAAQAALLWGYVSLRLSETTSARMQRLLDTTSWPAALEAFPASPVGTVSEIGSGTGVIPELQLVADSEGGELYVTKAGVLTMTARRDVFNATRSANSQATITDSGAGLRYGTELEIRYDADNLKNDVTVTFSGDGEVSATNSVTIAAYGAASTIVETQLDSPTSAADLATLELGVEGVLVPQVSPIDVSPNTAAADWQTILGLELLDRVTFKRTPTIGNQFSRAALINAIDHQVEPGVWRTQLTLSMRYTSPLTLNDSVLGKLDYNYLG